MAVETGPSIVAMRPLTGLRICYFGRYDHQYPRNVFLIKCLQRAGAEIIPIRDDRPLPLRTPALLRRASQTRVDLIIVAFRAHSDMLAARALASMKRVPLMFDPLTSRYEEKVVDRKLVRANSPLGRWYRATDKAGCQMADRILLETDAHIEFFSRAFGVPRAKCRRVWLGADDEIMRPLGPRSPSDRFTVFFYGRFSPLHGVEHIVRAAAMLEQRREPVDFVIVGAGQTYQASRALAESLGISTMTFLDPVPYPRLAELMTESDVCLGSFGTTARAQRVIPNKVFDALAVARPVLTADSPGVRESLVHGQHLWTCAPGDPSALAEAITVLKRDRDLRGRLAENGHRLFLEQFSLAATTRNLTEIVGQLVREHSAHSVPR